MADEPLTLDLLNRRLEDQAAFIAHETAMYREQIKQQDQQIAQALAEVKTATAGLSDIRAWVEQVAWAKAGDRIVAQWHQWVSYSDPRLLNLIYNRVLLHIKRLGIKDTSGEKQATPVDYS